MTKIASWLILVTVALLEHKKHQKTYKLANKSSRRQIERRSLRKRRSTETISLFQRTTMGPPQSTSMMRKMCFSSVQCSLCIDFNREVCPSRSHWKIMSSIQLIALRLRWVWSSALSIGTSSWAIARVCSCQRRCLSVRCQKSFSKSMRSTSKPLSREGQWGNMEGLWPVSKKT